MEAQSAKGDVARHRCGADTTDNSPYVVPDTMARTVDTSRAARTAMRPVCCADATGDSPYARLVPAHAAVTVPIAAVARNIMLDIFLVRYLTEAHLCARLVSHCFLLDQRVS